MKTLPNPACACIQNLSTLLWSLIAALFISFVLIACSTTPDAQSMARAEAHNKLATSYINNDQLNNAFVELQKSLQLDPQNKETLNSLGYISARFKKYDEAVSYYEKAIALDPQYSFARNNLGVAYLEMGQWDQAIEQFESALVNPTYGTPERAYTNMGYAYYKKGDYLNAESVLKEAETRNPTFILAMYRLGLVYKELGDDAAAIAELDRALKVAPDYLDARWELAQAYLRTGDNEKALLQFEKIAEQASDSQMGLDAQEFIHLIEQ
ncbi:MAG: tetratricopeptide repeat protein [Nitrospiraceae bacterium]|nr:MAG: tetratricopeptide repeat protein [Nitrospiraceae bacterium]